MSKQQTLSQVQQDVEGFVSAPAIDLEILIECQNVGSFEFISQPNQARVGEINLAVPVLAQELLDSERFP